MKRLLSLLGLALLVAGAAQASETSTLPEIDNPAGGDWVVRGGADVLLINTTTSALNQALNDLGVVYDEYIGSDFSGLDLSPYTHVFLAMDGGLVEEPSIMNAATYAGNGGNLHFYGGTCYQPYALAVNAHLVENDVNNYCWTTVGGAPHSRIADPDHCLSTGLPASYNFADISASYYQLRATDGAIAIAALNGDGYAHLFSKGIGSGNFDICINSPYASYYLNPNDYNWLKQVVENMLGCGGPVAVEESTFGQVKALYR